MHFVNNTAWRSLHLFWRPSLVCSRVLEHRDQSLCVQRGSTVVYGILGVNCTATTIVCFGKVFSSCLQFDEKESQRGPGDAPEPGNSTEGTNAGTFT